MSVTVSYAYVTNSNGSEILHADNYRRDHVDVSATSDGGFAIAYTAKAGGWAEHHTFDADGTAVRSTTYGAATAGGVLLPNGAVDTKIAALSDGATATVWTDASSGQNVVRAAIFSPLGYAKPFAFEAPGGDNSSPDIVALKDGGFVVTWQHLYAPGSTDNDIRATIFNADGSIRADNFAIDSGLANDGAPAIAALSKGGFVEAWTRVGANGSSSVCFKTFDANGLATSGSVLIDAYGHNSDIQVLGLKDGGFAVAYADTGWGANGNADITTRIFNADGTARSSFILANASASTDASESAPDLALLPNGFILVSWTNGDKTTSFTVLDAQGATVLAPQVLFGGDKVTNVALAALADGQFVAVGEHPSGPYTQVEGQVGGVVRTSIGDAAANEISGDALRDIIKGGGGADLLRGFGGADSLWGAAGADTLDGGLGADVMIGGADDDTYLVHDAGDKIVESADGGVDLVKAAVSHTLSAHVEKLALSGAANINATGNELANTLHGNTGANVLNGLAGADTMVGRAGDDTYVVDNAADVIVEVAGEGVDTVRASVSFKLAADDHVERMETADAAGTSAIDLTGNALSNSLYGNAGSNVLNGGAGADYLYGGLGDDVYIVNTIEDKIYEDAGGGLDWVKATSSYEAAPNVEKLTLLGTGDNFAYGNQLANVIVGNAGDNAICGYAGKDTLTGGLGDDVFQFFNLESGAPDTITDFNIQDDLIALDDSVFAGLTVGALAAGAFHVGKAAHDASDRIIYDKATGALFFDQDGAGGAAQIQFAKLTANLDLSAADFQIV